jgi:hypothetical protein
VWPAVNGLQVALLQVVKTLGACGRPSPTSVAGFTAFHTSTERHGLLMLLITCDSDTRSVRSYYTAAVAASHDEFVLPPCNIPLICIFSEVARSSISHSSRRPTIQKSNRWNANNGALPCGEANLWTTFRRG